MANSYAAAITFMLLGLSMLIGGVYCGRKYIKSPEGPNFSLAVVLVIDICLGYVIFDIGSSMLARLLA